MLKSRLRRPGRFEHTPVTSTTSGSPASHIVWLCAAMGAQQPARATATPLAKVGINPPSWAGQVATMLVQRSTRGCLPSDPREHKAALDLIDS